MVTDYYLEVTDNARCLSFSELLGTFSDWSDIIFWLDFAQIA